MVEGVVGNEIALRMGAISARAWVQHLLPHHHPRLRQLGVELAPMNDSDRRRLLDTVGSLRAGTHRWH